MDLSKAFDCMLHKLLVSKLEAYGVQPKSSKFILSYLFNRQQRVRVGEPVHGKPAAKEFHKDLFSVLCFSMFFSRIYFIL